MCCRNIVKEYSIQYAVIVRDEQHRCPTWRANNKVGPVKVLMSEGMRTASSSMPCGKPAVAHCHSKPMFDIFVRGAPLCSDLENNNLDV